jgi:predicted N-formylglutamate amidohydrolase
MTGSVLPRSARLLLTCEHGGNKIPAAYRSLFRGGREALESHRGWDPGALALARAVGARLRVPVLAVTWSRLFVEANRAPTNPRIWSRFTAGLPPETKGEILARYWWPHRRRVEEAVRRLARGGRQVIHVAVHSFTPVLDGEVRTCDVGLLYDPARPSERALCGRWERRLEELLPAERTRRNYPYKGTGDGLPTWLRRRFPDRAYAGVELEANQALLATPRRTALARALAECLTPA